MRILKDFLSQSFPFGRMADFAKSEAVFNSSQILVRVHYFFLLYASIGLFSRWDITIGPQTTVNFILPISWISLVAFPTAVSIIRISFIGVSLLATLVPHWRWVRILSFITVLEFVSLYYSVLQLDVDWYVWLLSTFILIFLPDGWDNPIKLPYLQRQKFLLVFWATQAVFLLTYSMSGIGKILGAVNQISQGQSNFFEPKAAALHIADRFIKTGETSPLGPWLVDNYLVAWPFFTGTLYLLLFSFVAAFRPNLHRLWGLGLIFFHIGNYLIINIGFSAHILLSCLLLISSPFAPIKLSWREAFFDLPMLGWFLKLVTPITWRALLRLRYKKLSFKPVFLTALALLTGLIGVFLILSSRKDPLKIQTLYLQINDGVREYLVYLPDGLEARPAAVLALHGGGGPLGTAELMAYYSGWTNKAEVEGFIAVFPQGTLEDPNKPVNVADKAGKNRNIRDWNEGSGRTASSKKAVDDVAYISAVIDDLEKRFSIDRRRVFATGFSNGATMTLRLGIDLSTRLAAIGPIAGSLFVDKPIEDPVSMINIAGTLDKPQVDMGSRLAKELRQATVPLKDHISHWKRQLSCPEYPEVVADSDKLQTFKYSLCKDGSEIAVYRIKGLGHVYPGLSWLFSADPNLGDVVNANDLLWEFFKTHPKTIN